MLDPANYSPVTITKAISITGVEGAGINASAGVKALTIKAGPKDIINITNLIIDGLNTGMTGIELDSFGSFTVTRSTVRNFHGDGIDIFAGSGTVFLISDAVVSDNGGLGLELVGVPGTLDHVIVNHNGISNPCGFICGSIRAAQGAAVVSIVDCIVANNTAPIDSEDGATIRFFHSFVPDGIGFAGGTAIRVGNNFIDKTGLTEVGTY